MNQMEVFKNKEFGSIRVIEENDKYLFCGSDVAKALGYARPNEAVSKHCRGTLKRRTPTAGGIQEMLFIPEGDVYRLIVHSKLPSAERFEKWVFEELLPTSRGGHHTGPAAVQPVYCLNSLYRRRGAGQLSLQPLPGFPEPGACDG